MFDFNKEILFMFDFIYRLRYGLFKMTLVWRQKFSEAKFLDQTLTRFQFLNEDMILSEFLTVKYYINSKFIPTTCHNSDFATINQVEGCLQ